MPPNPRISTLGDMMDSHDISPGDICMLDDNLYPMWMPMDQVIDRLMPILLQKLAEQGLKAK